MRSSEELRWIGALDQLCAEMEAIRTEFDQLAAELVALRSDMSDLGEELDQRDTPPDPDDPAH